MNNRGTSLVEVLVGLVLVSVTILISTYFLTGMRFTQTASVTSTGQAFARSYLDLVRGTWSNRTFYESNTLPISAGGGGFDPPAGFTYTVRVRNVSEDTAADILTYEHSTKAAPSTVTDVSAVVLKEVELQITSRDGKVMPFTTRIVAPPN